MGISQAASLLTENQLGLMLDLGSEHAVDALEPIEGKRSPGDAQSQTRWRVSGVNRTAMRRLLFTLSGESDDCVGESLVDARTHTRYQVNIPVSAVALRDGWPSGESLRLTMIDISAGGARLASFDSIEGDDLLVHVVTAALGVTPLVGTIVRRERRGPVTQLGVRFNPVG
ncbi:MAG: PilZ domain-containing protein [Planctomycetota bacterium]